MGRSPPLLYHWFSLSFSQICVICTDSSFGVCFGLWRGNRSGHVIFYRSLCNVQPPLLKRQFWLQSQQVETWAGSINGTKITRTLNRTGVRRASLVEKEHLCSAISKLVSWSRLKFLYFWIFNWWVWKCTSCWLIMSLCDLVAHRLAAVSSKCLFSWSWPDVNLTCTKLQWVKRSLHCASCCCPPSPVTCWSFSPRTNHLTEVWTVFIMFKLQTNGFSKRLKTRFTFCIFFPNYYSEVVNAYKGFIHLVKLLWLTLWLVLSDVSEVVRGQLGCQLTC